MNDPQTEIELMTTPRPYVAMQRINLMVALSMAIATLKENDRKMGYVSGSALESGFQEALDHLRDGYDLRLIG